MFHICDTYIYKSFYTRVHLQIYEWFLFHLEEIKLISVNDFIREHILIKKIKQHHIKKYNKHFVLLHYTMWESI